MGREKRVVLAGFGRVGHRIGWALSQANVPYVAVDYVTCDAKSPCHHHADR